MKMRTLVIPGLAVAVCLTLVAWSSPDEVSSTAAAQSITLAELRDHMFYLASDELAGRLPGTQGYRDAAIYCATQFREAGLQPIVSGDDGELTYLQPIRMKKIYKSDNNRIVVHRGEESTVLAHAFDYAMLSAGKGGNHTVEGIGVAYVGFGISEPDAGWDDYEGLDVKGLMVLMQAGAPTDENGESLLPESIRDKYSNVQRGLMPKIMTVMKKGAAGVLIAPSGVGHAEQWSGVVSLLSRPRMAVVGEQGGFDPISMIQVPFFFAGAEAIDVMLVDAPYNPMEKRGEYGTFIIEGVTLDLEMEVLEEEFTTHNVVGMVEGSDPELKDEYVTVGAHLDHDGIIGGDIFNGADDNASGSVAVLEMAEALAMTPPRRSVILVLYSAEESGLFGSSQFVQNCPVPVEDIVVNINLDMVGRETEECPGGVQVIGSAKRSTQLKQIVIDSGASIDGLALDFSFDENDPENYFGRSDHIHFHNKGIPIVCFSTGEHPQYHRPTDDAELIDYEKLQKVTQLSYEIALTVGNLDERLVQDVEAQ